MSATQHLVETLPPNLYREQHEKSFTSYEPGHGFFARGHYLMDWCHWINKGKIEKHLNWNNRSDEPTPFISTFNNYGKPDPKFRLKLELRQLSLFNSCCRISSSVSCRSRSQGSLRSTDFHIFLTPNFIAHCLQ